MVNGNAAAKGLESGITITHGDEYPWLVSSAHCCDSLCLFATQLASVPGSVPQDRKDDPGYLTSTYQVANIYPPIRLGSGTDCGGPVREAEIEGEIQRA